MRELDLQQVHDELLRLQVQGRFDAARITPVLKIVRADLQNAQAWPNAGTEPTLRMPLNKWWATYPGLGFLIPE